MVKRKYKTDLVNSRLYRIWAHMKNRCIATKGAEYRNYASRGITVCDEWKNDFLNFYNWAMANGYSDNLSIDRINNDKGYYPDNCRWATAKQQVNNTRVNHRITFNSETHTVSEWAQILNVTPMSIFRRLYKGWREEEALTIPRFGKRTIQEEPMTTQDIMDVCKQSISCGLCKNKKEFCEMSGISKYVFFSIQKGQYKISDGIYLKVKAMQDKILKIEERKEKCQ